MVKSSRDALGPVAIPVPGAASQLAAIVESTDDAMIGKTLEGVITSWNMGAERMYGYGAAEIVGHNVSVLVPPDRLIEVPDMLERIAKGERVEHYETRRVRKDGTIFDVSVSISPIRDAGGAIVGASTVTLDITGRKRAEAELGALQDQLRQAQRLETVGQLAGGIVHDFNNLLAAIMNYAALVSDGLADLTVRLSLGADEGVAIMVQDAAEIAEVVTRAAHLTRQLLIFSRREVAKAEVLDLNAVVVDMEKLLRRTIGEAVVLAIDLASDLPRVKVDRGQIEQVLMNLAVNARDAMASDGGCLRIATASFEADETYAGLHHIRAGLYIRLTVSDTGSGMRPEVAAWAFEPFFTTKPKGEGSGLGLATVCGIATQAGGDVVLYSEPDLGTTIRVDLPATLDPFAAPCTPVPPLSLTSGGETILLVEDEDMVRVPTGRMLTRYGYRVLVACDGKEALRIAGEHLGEIELLLTDVVMPGRSGKALADELCQLRPATRVLYMSGYSQDVIVHHEILDDGVHLIEKPFAAENLLRRIREILTER